MTATVPHRWYADRTLALVGYGLLFSSIFFAGLTGLVAVILAYSVRDGAKPGLRVHFDGQIRIFWIAVALSAAATVAGVAGAVFLVGDVGDMVDHSNGRALAEAFTAQIAEFRYDLRVVGLLGLSGILWLATALWLLCGPTIGFIRLATTGPEA